MLLCDSEQRSGAPWLWQSRISGHLKNRLCVFSYYFVFVRHGQRRFGHDRNSKSTLYVSNRRIKLHNTFGCFKPSTWEEWICEEEITCVEYRKISWRRTYQVHILLFILRFFIYVRFYIIHIHFHKSISYTTLFSIIITTRISHGFHFHVVEEINVSVEDR